MTPERMGDVNVTALREAIERIKHYRDTHGGAKILLSDLSLILEHLERNPP